MLPDCSREYLKNSCGAYPPSNSRLRRSIGKFQFLLTKVTKHNPMPDIVMIVCFRWNAGTCNESWTPKPTIGAKLFVDVEEFIRCCHQSSKFIYLHLSFISYNT